MATLALLNPVASEMASVEEVLARVCQVENPLLAEALRHVLRSGGKRVRSALVLLSSAFHPYPRPPVIQLAAATECLHAATLVHDDIIDNAATRRGVETVNVRWSNTIAVLTGDYLFAKSAEMIAALGSTEVMGLMARAVMAVCQGEIEEPALKPGADHMEEQYYRTIRQKTAHLMVFACEAAATLTGAPSSVVRAFHDYAMNIGMAFQIADDILDITGSEDLLGKPVGSDLREGVLTLPVIRYLQQHPNDPRILRVLGSEDGEADVALAVELIKRSGAVDQAYARAREFASAAIAALDGLPHNAHRQALVDLAEYVVRRRS